MFFHKNTFLSRMMIFSHNCSFFTHMAFIYIIILL